MICNIVTPRPHRLRRTLEEGAKRFDSLFQAFRIVEPVYPDDEVAAFEARERALHGRALFGGTGFLGEGLGVDADGKRADLHPAAVDLAPIAAGDSARIGTHDAVAEIIRVGLGLKTNDIIGSKRAKDALITGQGARKGLAPSTPCRSPGASHMFSALPPIAAGSELCLHVRVRSLSFPRH